MRNLIDCNVLCLERTDGVIEELDETKDIWLPCCIDLTHAICIKKSGHTDYAENAVIYFPGHTDNYFIIDLMYDEVRKMFRELHQR